ncbi:MAG TPA: 6-pyruvoyl-tetrahydropterin synthase-related protein [Dehalococcoidia bacterium]|nr:6-pyruvoyl-tetrahydropterin synthase-related protein [Dehalococcoidia bacterium]
MRSTQGIRARTGLPVIRDPYLLLAVLASAMAALPLLGPYFVGSHDGILAVYRFFEFDRSIQDGILLPRWAPDLFFGYGYPFFNFYGPLSYYVAEGFHLLGIGFVGSISATFALGFVLSGLFMYLFVRDLAGPWAGFLAALAYVFAPYHLVNAHLRGDLAEFFAFAWFPAILWAGGRLVSRGGQGYLALTALLYGALLTTHNIMALAFSPLLAAYVVFLLVAGRRGDLTPWPPSLRGKGEENSPPLAGEGPGERSTPGPRRPASGPGTAFGRHALYPLAAILLAFGLSAFFWLPALMQVDDIQIGRLANDPSYYYKTSLMQASSFVSDAIVQDYGPRTPEGDYGYPVELGLIQEAMAGAGLAILIWHRGRGGKREAHAYEGMDLPAEVGVAPRTVAPTLAPTSASRRVHPNPFLFLAVAALAYYAVMFPWSLFLWDNVPLMSYLQSPWRLLPFLILSTSALVGYLGRWASGLRPRLGIAALALLALLATVPNVVNLQPRYVDLREEDVSVPGSLRFEMSSQNLGMTAAGEYLPKGVRSKMTASPPALEAVSRGQPIPPFDPSFLVKGADVQVLESRTARGRFRVNSPDGTPFLLNQTYFPGWTAYVDGREVALHGVGTANLMSIQVPPGQHDVEFRFEDTRARLLGQAISAASLAALLVLVLLARHRRRTAGASGPDEQTPVTSAEPSRTQPSTTKHDQARPSTIAGLQALLAFLVPTIVVAAILLGLRPAPPSPNDAVFPVEAAWAGGPLLLGYDLKGPDLRPAQETSLTLYWRDPPAGQEVRIGLKGRTGVVWPMTGAAVQDLAKNGRLYKDARSINVPAEAPPGMYQITLDVLNGGKPLPIQKEGLARPVFPEKTLVLGPVLVGRGEPVGQGQVTIPNRREDNLDNQASFLGYGMALGARSLDLITYWKALSTMREDYAVLSHLLDPGEKVLAYKDLQPLGNPYPTTLWRPGELVTVPFHFDLPPDFVPEKHRVAIGLYTPDNFKRVPLLDPAGHPYTDTIYLALTPAQGK